MQFSKVLMEKIVIIVYQFTYQKQVKMQKNIVFKVIKVGKGLTVERTF